MTMKEIHIFWLFFFLVSAQIVSAQTPPGNITGDLEIWYDASDINGDNDETNNPIDGTEINIWVNKANPGTNDAVIFPGKNGAILETDPLEQINRRPVLKFDRINARNGSIYDTGLDIRAGVMEDMTIFLVYKPKTATVGVQQSPWGIDNGGWDRFYYSSFPHGLTRNNPETGIVALGPSSNPRFEPIPEASRIDQVYLQTTAYNGNVIGNSNQGPADGSAVYFNGDVVTTFTDTTDPSNAFTSLTIGWDGDGGAFDGQIAEILVYSRILTACELETINLALGAKYGRDFSGFVASYDGTGTYFENVNAIGISGSACMSGSVQVDEAASGGLTINNPSSNDTLNEFLIFAHNDTADNTISNNAPAGTTIRQERAWYVEEETSGNNNGPAIELGTVDLSFDLGALGFNGSGIDRFILLIDDDGDFSDATISGTGTYDSGNVIFTGIDLEHQDFFTLAILDNTPPSVTIEQASAQNDPEYADQTVAFTVTFSEPIDLNTFDCNDIIISGTASASCSGITQVSPNDRTTFEVTINATSEGTVIASIPDAVVQDIVGNTNSASTSIDNSVTISYIFWDIGVVPSEDGNEVGIPVTYTVTLRDSSGNLFTNSSGETIIATIDFTGSAEQNDFTTTFPATAEILNNQSSTTITLNINDDILIEPTENLTASI